MNLSFIKLDINIMNDTKIKLIRKMPDGDSILVLWIGLLCLGMKSGRPGILELGDGIPFTGESLSVELDIPLNTVKLGLETFQHFKMIEVWENGETYLINFEKYQSLDKIEDIKIKSRESSKRYREKKKAELLLEQTSDLCAYCGGPNELAEHIIPLSKKGLNIPKNIVPACIRCNSHKGVMDVSKFLNNNSFIDIERVLNTPNLANLIIYKNNKFSMNDISVTSLSLTVTESDETEEEKKRIEEEKKRLEEQNIKTAKDVITILNKFTGKRFQQIKTNHKFVMARLNENNKLTLDDFERVIKVKMKDEYFIKNNGKYLRPKTLFGTNFDSYLNEYTELKGHEVPKLDRIQANIDKVKQMTKDGVFNES